MPVTAERFTERRVVLDLAGERSPDRAVLVGHGLWPAPGVDAGALGAQAHPLRGNPYMCAHRRDRVPSSRRSSPPRGRVEDRWCCRKSASSANYQRSGTRCFRERTSTSRCSCAKVAVRVLPVLAPPAGAGRLVLAAELSAIRTPVLSECRLSAPVQCRPLGPRGAKATRAPAAADAELNRPAPGATRDRRSRRCQPDLREGNVPFRLAVCVALGRWSIRRERPPTV
jgi:hypothetical protein